MQNVLTAFSKHDQNTFQAMRRHLTIALLLVTNQITEWDYANSSVHRNSENSRLDLSDELAGKR